MDINFIFKIAAVGIIVVSVQLDRGAAVVRR